MEETTLALPQRSERQFLKDDFNPAMWAGVEPYYKQLLEREINSLPQLQQWLKNWSELQAALEENNRWVYVHTTIDTTDEKAKAALTNLYQNIYPQATACNYQLEKKLIACPYTEQLDAGTFFTTIRKMKKQVEMFRAENIPLLSEMNIKQSRFDEITGAHSITYNGSELTLQQAAVYFTSNNRQQREDVFRLVGERRLQDAEQLDQLLSELVKLRHQIALNAGYENYLQYRFDELSRFDYTPADCLAFHKAVKETVVPVLNRLANERKAKLGYDTLRPWDLEVDTSGQPPLKPVNNTNELVEKTITCFNRLDRYFGERLEIMKRMNYLDLESRMGKGPGGYNMTMPEIGVPFIFMNSANTEHDLITMVHEGGHAVHTFLAHPLELTAFKEVTSEIAEVASMGMELMSMEHWDVFYTNSNDLNRAKRNHLNHILGILAKTCVGDSFQFWMYQNPEHTAEERRKKWKELFLEFSADNIDWTGSEEFLETGYQKILHFYVVPLYYIEYAFAQLGALAVWKNFKANPQKAVQDYKNALSLGFTKPIPVFYETAGAKFDFSKERIAELMGFMEAEMKKLQ
ncbi:MAG: M3 family oligoendopeptidase [Chitinophagales bacterium]|nr:M3 family oligoendopeptidase [Chitinophagales bacterium]